MITFNTGSSSSRRRTNPLGCLFSSLPFFIGALLFGYFLIYPSWHARWQGVQTQGTVTSTVDCPEDSGGDMVLGPFLAQDSGSGVTATIQFIDQHGQTHQVTVDICGNYTKGQVVTVWYLPSDPQTFTTDQQFTATYPLIGVMGVFALPFVISLLLLLLQ